MIIIITILIILASYNSKQGVNIHPTRGEILGSRCAIMTYSECKTFSEVG